MKIEEFIKELLEEEGVHDNGMNLIRERYLNALIIKIIKALPEDVEDIRDSDSFRVLRELLASLNSQNRR